MTDKLTTLSSANNGLLTPKSIKLTLISLGLMAAAQQIQAAEEEWWFDVEVILFERELAPDGTSEKFKQSDLKARTVDTLDLLSPYLTPDTSYLVAGLPYCRSSKREYVAIKEQRDLAIPNMQWVQSLTSALDGIDIPEIKSETTALETDNPIAAIDPGTSEMTEIATNEDGSEYYKSQLPEISYIEWQIPTQLPCAYSEQIDPLLTLNAKVETKTTNPLIAAVPVKIDGLEWQTKTSAFLLPQEQLRMEKLYQSIKYQRGITPLLHLAWRQQTTFGRENSQAIRLFAGKNYGETYTKSGELIPQDTDSIFEKLKLNKQDDYIPEAEKSLDFQPSLSELASRDEQSSAALFMAIDKALEDNSKPNLAAITKQAIPLENSNELDSPESGNIWQIDGEVSVYLRNVGRVPYLHIDSNLDYRHPVFDIEHSLQPLETEEGSISTTLEQQPNFLENANFDQLRRVISKQVHYFDHPLFGMIVTINRYNWPEVEEVTEE